MNRFSGGSNCAHLLKCHRTYLECRCFVQILKTHNFIQNSKLNKLTSVDLMIFMYVCKN